MDTATREYLLAKKEKVSKQFKKVMQELYGERLAKVILYGSYARGDFHEESDIDFLVVLNDESINTFREVKFVNEQINKIVLEWSMAISFVPMNIKRFEKAKTPLLHFIRKEGKIL
ncbi:nucleotidyltransferase domain-containing protein [Thermoflexibacter ruber]|uniref:Nucleotidyltransferase domain-containing protein n=1 Tax=Thermoflexibacter ruber TaxID=1003 RepID=A0A1I2BND6_9BACT|nr:nucleotidyltransferase domain-containing protein [Thermoflexibacter ruber]SFE57684.1 Nucleotidyltransferase domain-containing protein [Thermoflexibacter ruber]